MITGEIKNRIDQIWDSFWTGGITNSITILEQMTYLFFMKMLDDAEMQREADAAAWGMDVDEPVFPKGVWTNPDTGGETPFEQLRWHVFKNLDPTLMFRLVSTEVFAFIKNLGSGDETAYSRYMQNAVFMIPTARNLTKIVEGIDALPMGDRDAMGDVYEYILGKMAASGTNGQFRTPRHIIKMMVELMQPTLQDTICDPAMGSAGFIVEAAKYVKERHEDEILMNPEAKNHFEGDMFNGFDTDQTMLRIGAMNLMLHKVEHPNVAYQDSLSDSNTDTNKYSLCLANPPFAGTLDTGSIAKSLLAITNTKKTELLFLALFVRMLQMGGRCASIVPDGVLFGTSNAHLALRKEIIDNQCLRAVISMPSGVFQPYSGVSTAILIFTKTNAGGTDKVWFYDMQADGYSLDQKRNEIADNDIPDIIERFKSLSVTTGDLFATTPEDSRTRKDKSFLVPVDEIRANDYVLSINKYKEVEREVVQYDAPEVIWDRISSLENDIVAAQKEFMEKYLKA